mmetsp:Transcript_7321/g.6932  ORF Transcript_7321/g.6932 Transcript_7321/m.6932 type:complete len:92 (+) Transcript_7321:104-379(+)
MASRQAIAKVRREVFGQIQKKKGLRTGSEVLEKRWTGIIEARYYPESITPLAKKFMPGYLSPKEERRQDKLEGLRRRGKGPPKKGSGKRKK